MSILHIEGFDQYATQADIASAYAVPNPGSFETRTDTPLGRGRSVRHNRTSGAHAGLTKAIPSVAQGAYVGSSFWLKVESYPYGHGYCNIIQFREGSTSHICLDLDDKGFLQFVRGGSSSVSPIFNRPLDLNVWYHVEVRVLVSDATGEVEVRINGETWGAASGLDTQYGGTGVLDNVALFCSVSSSSSRQGVYVGDSWVVWDTQGTTNNDWLGDVEVLTSLPSGDDTPGTWVANTGALWEAIDEADPDGDTTYISSSTLDDAATFTMGALPVTPERVLAVSSQVLARKDDSGPRSIAHGVVSGAVEALSEDQSLGLTYGLTTVVFEQDPATAAPWTGAAAQAVKTKVKVSV
ncbi:hypothetical protein [Nitratireductor sp. OM-1]|uniref:hypothetical protein n=1 Tax=Nitratireductor sp. OM-1 TaxID=1756988 RepID=UPI000DDF32BD|nr:hypothetical protein [Nitratireductor sp. OM-1]